MYFGNSLPIAEMYSWAKRELEQESQK